MLLQDSVVSSKNECLPVVSLYGRVIPLSLKRFKCMCSNLMQPPERCCGTDTSLREKEWKKGGGGGEEEYDDNAKKEKVCMLLVAIYWTSA